MTCLNDAQIQHVVDGEGVAEEQAHVATCRPCADRVRARAALVSAMRTAVDPTSAMPPDLSARVLRALDGSGSRGATRLRRDLRPRAGAGRRVAYSGIAVAAATLVVIFVLLPFVKGSSTVSAAEILGKSASQLDAHIASGVETLEYDLTVNGLPSDLWAQGSGTYRIRQVIDHDVPGHFHFSSYEPGGLLMTSIAQDPRAGTRVMAIRLDDRLYRFEMTLAPGAAVPLPDLERLHMEASVSMMQASGDQQLRVIDTPQGRQYRVDVPAVAGMAPAAIWDLSEGHVTVDAGDYHIEEFAVTGTLFQQPYSLSYRLIHRDVQPASAVPADAFQIPNQDGEMLLHGEASAIPPRDALATALRALSAAQAKP